MNEFSEQLKSAEGREWLAMLYVLAELSDDQMAAFDAAMADNLALCEAVAEASRLCSGVALACESERAVVRPSIRRNRPSWLRRIGVFSGCLSLLALLLILVRSQVADQMSGETSLANETADADALVGLLQYQLSSGDDSDGEQDNLPEDSLADLMAPEWLLTAVDLEEPASSDDEDQSDDSRIF